MFRTVTDPAVSIIFCKIIVDKMIRTRIQEINISRYGLANFIKEVSRPVFVEDPMIVDVYALSKSWLKSMKNCSSPLDSLLTKCNESRFWWRDVFARKVGSNNFKYILIAKKLRFMHHKDTSSSCQIQGEYKLWD